MIDNTPHRYLREHIADGLDAIAAGALRVPGADP
jgi:hypothetical protein